MTTLRDVVASHGTRDRALRDLTHDTEVDLRGERDGARECHVPGCRDGIPGWSKEDPKEDHEDEGQTAWQWGVPGQRL